MPPYQTALYAIYYYADSAELKEVISLEFLNTLEKETLLGYPYFT